MVLEKKRSIWFYYKALYLWDNISFQQEWIRLLWKMSIHKKISKSHSRPDAIAGERFIKNHKTSTMMKFRLYNQQNYSCKKDLKQV